MPESHHELKALYNDAPDALYVHDLAWRLIRVNRAFERLSGYTREEKLGGSFLDLVAPDHREKLIQTIQEQIGGAPVQPFEIDLVTRQGPRVALQITTALIVHNGQAAGVQGCARNITDRNLELEALTRKTAELTEEAGQLAQLNSHLQALHRLSTTFYADLDALFADYLETGCRILGLPHAAIWQLTPDGLVARAAHGEDARVEDPARAMVVANKSTVVHDGSDQRCACPLYVGTPLMQDGGLFGSMGFWSKEPGDLHPNAREIIELMAQGITNALRPIHSREELEVSAGYDPLTKVSNRLLLSRKLETALAHARDSGSMAAVLFIDLDRFKRINHSFGRSAGDRYLEHIGSKLQAHMRSGDTLARMGGDEFTAILPDTGEHEEVIAVAHRLLDAIRAPYRLDRDELTISASIGMSVYPRDGVDAGALLRNALAAMFAAERRGSDCAQLYSTEDTKSAVARLAIATSLRGALERSEFRLYYQPQVDFQGQLAGVEALLGWLHPELGSVPPHEFIPIAEESGMILPIGNWVLREACRQAAEWRQTTGVRLTTAVNVSAIQFAHHGFVDSIATLLAETGLAPDLLELELTESLLLRDMQQAMESLSTLRGLGVRIAIDDFGTGYSSLRYIRHLPLDAVKIDRSFVVGLKNDPVSVGLLRAIVALGHTLGLRVTAEGIETRAQLRTVRLAGCDLAQGHLFGVAIDAERMGDLLRQPQPLFAAIAHGKRRAQKGG
jgi:diguanylate cyclase (GGDEF)-like protein/PAS domain S-box-containing protein